MDEIEALLASYRRFVETPWDRHLSGSERVWFAVYSPFQERKLRFRLPDFAVATQSSGHPWRHVDLTGAFARWMAAQEYRESYFESPEDMTLTLEKDFGGYVVELVSREIAGTDEQTVVAVSGVASLFGLVRVSEVVAKAAPEVPGRLLVFFPGEHEGGSYRLLNARDGWNYLAIPIAGERAA